MEPRELTRARLRVAVSPQFVFAERRELAGSVTLAGTLEADLDGDWPWLARFVSGHDFAHVPEAARIRSWAQDWPAGEGIVLSVHPRLLALEPVLRLRLALALEQTAAQTRFDGELGRRLPARADYLIDNVVSAEKPVWAANLPALEPLAVLSAAGV
jgi:hypothetical protein